MVLNALRRGAANSPVVISRIGATAFLAGGAALLSCMIGLALASGEDTSGKDHWSFRALARPALPCVRRAEGVRSPVDLYVLADIERTGATRNAEANKTALLRRVTYDLIGLPPTYDQIEAFLGDESPDAYERVVERLLASPRYGERWGRHWLNAVGFAQTEGYEDDVGILGSSEYRDYVIRAFNEDVPYDVFIKEHLAGDLLAAPRVAPVTNANESRFGTVFLQLGPVTPSPADLREEEATRTEWQIEALSRAFLGLSVACARCHDHKTDAISTDDYYALAGCLKSSRCQETIVYPANVREAVSEIEQIDREFEESARSQVAVALLAALRSPGFRLEYGASAYSSDPRMASIWRQVWHDPLEQRSTSILFPAIALSAGGSDAAERFVAARRAVRARLLAESERARNAVKAAILFDDFDEVAYRNWFVTGCAFGTAPTQGARLVFGNNGEWPVKRLLTAGVASSQHVSARLVGNIQSKALKLERSHVWFRAAGRRCTVNVIVDGYRRLRFPAYNVLTREVSGDEYRWYPIDVSAWRGRSAYIEIRDPGEGTIVIDRIVLGGPQPPLDAPNSLIGDMLRSDDIRSRDDLTDAYQRLFCEVVSKWQASPGDLTHDEIEILDWLLRNPQLFLSSAERATLARSAERRANLENKLLGPMCFLSTIDGSPDDTQADIRGDPHQAGPRVKRRYLSVFGGQNVVHSAGESGRLGFAELLANHLITPIVPRVIVNRIWHHHFARGLVPSIDDLGRGGDAPSNPDLLEYLAWQFVVDGCP